MTSAFDLTRNPFYLLDLSIRARREQVVEAHEEALADGRADEGDLLKAQQDVLTPKTRIAAELSWFPDIRPSQAREILSGLERNHLADARRTLGNLQGLDKANLAAHLCARSVGETEYVHVLLGAYEDFSAGDVQETLEGLRRVSGFPIPDQQQVSSALADLRVDHAKAAVACLTTAKNPGEALTEIVEAFLDWGDDDVEHLLDRIVQEYGKGSQSRLATIKERIEAAIAAYKGGGDLVPVERLVNLLAEWDSVSQPVQLLDESKGHEEPRSKEVYGIVRDFCLWLANEGGQYQDALAILRALLETFPELPAAAKQLSEDVDALEPLAEISKSIESLVRTVEAIQKNTTTFNDDVVASGFGPESRGLAKSLYEAFVDVAAKTAGTELADMPWMVVRGLAIDLNNKHDSPKGAFAILVGLISQAVRSGWRSKGAPMAFGILDGLDLAQRLGKLPLKDVPRAFAILEGLISHEGTAPSKAVIERLKDDLQTLHRNLEWEEIRERKREVTERVFWGMGLAAFVVGVVFLVYVANKEPSHAPRSSPTTEFTPSTSRTSTSTPSSPAPVVSPKQYTTAEQKERYGVTPSPQFEEQIPPPGAVRPLNRSEVRYCIFQGERLDILRGLVSSNDEIDRFNRLIGDFNSRCSSFRYREDVLQAVQAEVSGRRQQLRQDAQRLLLIDVSTVSGAVLVQNRLKELGYYAGQVDGIWGTASRTALRNFKLQQSGLRYDDRWDLATQRALMGR